MPATPDPLGDRLDAAGTPADSAGWAALRHDFSSWVPWNIARAVLTVAAFGALTWALVLHGRATTEASEQSAPAIPVASETGTTAAEPMDTVAPVIQVHEMT